MNQERSRKLFEEAQKYLPGGVNSPVRAFKGVGGTPVFMEKGKGSKLYDADGNEYTDFVCSWGPLILGHAHPAVTEALRRAVELGTSFGTPTELETELARLVCDAMPSVETVRFVNSGTEASMSALRLARAFTDRDKVMKFDGGYHGHSDGLLAKSGSGMATLSIPMSPGVPASFAENTLIAPYNDLDAVEQLFKQNEGNIAAVIVEPVAGNMGVVPPAPGFLAGLRQLTERAGALLVFDEVITGFRVAYGGAQALYGVTPDLTCLGKIIGGGLPVGAYGGKREIMEKMAPTGAVYQAGTLSGNPLAMTAGIATISELGKAGVYEQLESAAGRLGTGIKKAAEENGATVNVSRVGSMMTVFFTTNPAINRESVGASDTAKYGQFFWRLLEGGVYWPPSQFEAVFVSLAHSEGDIDSTVSTIGQAFQSLT